MKLHSITCQILVWASIAYLGAAYLQAGYWQILPAILGMALFWMTLKRRSIFWTASSLLLAYVLLAAIGLAIHLPLTLIGLGCTCALAGWDLVDFRQSISRNQITKYTVPLIKNHLYALAAMVGLSLFLIFVSSSIDLQFSFGGIAFLALLAMGSLLYGIQHIRKSVREGDK